MAPNTHMTEDQVRQRAFELWEKRGCPVGYEAEFWHQAERELKGEANSGGISANATSAKSGSGSDGPA
ncbi:DUF2934 domain-containing protein [Microvirga sp. TS319]|uniref:DUF2934 domain-containing protein n=1 Tax=Microvirga sp. TS319 TaxID=3241165 RepID=UPI00351A54AD